MLKGIVKTISESDFIAEFKKYNRQDNFSITGLRHLFESLKNLSDDMGEPVELDVIALCCEFNEDYIDDVIGNYSIDIPAINNDDKQEVIFNHLKDDDQGVNIITELFQLRVEDLQDIDEALEAIADHVYDNTKLLNEVISELGLCVDSLIDEDNKIEAVREYLQERTYFIADYEIPEESGQFFLYQAF